MTRPALLALLLVLAPLGAFALEPQAEALLALQAASGQAPIVHFANGGMRTGSFDVAVGGGSSIARAETFLRQYGGLFAPGFDTTLEPRRVDPDASPAGPREVVTFMQKYRGVPLWGAQLSVALAQPPGGGTWRARLAAGSLFSDLRTSVDTTPAISEAAAIAAARAQLARPTAPVLGDVALQIVAPGMLPVSGRDPCAIPCLAWVLTLGGGVPTEVLVDADRSLVLLAHPLVETSAGLDDYSADFEDANGDNITDTNCFNPTTVDDDIGSEDGIISSYHGNADAVNVWWHARNTYLFYHDSYGRHSWDDDDGEVVVYINSGPPPPPNPPSPGATSYSHGCGVQIEPGWVAYDVMVHEFTHAVIRYSPSDLIYSFQPGALNESYADTMGAVADTPDWYVAEDRTGIPGAIRSLEDPPVYGDPDRMSSFVVTSADFGGVHTNSGIMNKAHFLMAEGGFFNDRTVGQVGRVGMGHLVYTLLRFLWPSAAFNDARNLAVATAQYFSGGPGWDAADVCAVRNAYAAVGVGLGDLDCDGIEDDGEDTDGDTVPDSTDNCVTVPNPSQWDSDENGQGDACEDADGDGIANAVDNCSGMYNPWQTDVDSDGAGDECDLDDDQDTVPDLIDNCPEDFNPTQFDGNMDGEGDACNPDSDGDGVYDVTSNQLDDNCFLVPNANQTDADMDDWGDACDLCPNVPDNSNPYSPCPPSDPCPLKPYQPDSDGDGTPDACDSLPFGGLSLQVDGSGYNPADAPVADGTAHSGAIGGSGAGFKIPFQACGTGNTFLLDEMVQLAFTGLDPGIDAWIADERGRRVARLRGPGPAAPRGMRFQPDCARRYFLHFRLGPGSTGDPSFGFVASEVLAETPNPWVSPGGGEPPPPVVDVELPGWALALLAGLAIGVTYRRRLGWRSP